MKRKLKIIIPIAIAVITIIIAALCINFNPEEMADISALVSTAQKYLIEQNYEQAIAEFEKVIELDPMNVDAYISIAEAYEGMGDTDKAIEWLEKGYELTGDERILEKLEELRQTGKANAVTEGTAVTTVEAVTTTAVKLLTVPDLSGMSEEEAVAACGAAGIYYEIITAESENIEKGSVVSQRIPANAAIEEKIKLTFVVSEGKKEVTTAATTVTTAVPTTAATAVTTTVSTAAMTTVTTMETTTAPVEEFITIKGKQYSTALTELHLDPVLALTDVVTDEDIKPLSKMINLTGLDLGYNNNISDISTLRGLTNLTSLNLEYNDISDISPLSELTNLNALTLEHNNISDISPLIGLTDLTYLNLRENDISDIGVLNKLTNLTDLDLQNNNISDISVLSELTNLTELDLESNNISDISALKGLTNLTSLDLRNNNISKSDIEELKQALPNCFIYEH